MGILSWINGISYPNYYLYPNWDIIMNYQFHLGFQEGGNRLPIFLDNVMKQILFGVWYYGWSCDHINVYKPVNILIYLDQCPFNPINHTLYRSLALWSSALLSLENRKNDPPISSMIYWCGKPPFVSLRMIYKWWFFHICVNLNRRVPSHVRVPFRGLPCRTKERGGIRVPGAQWTVHERHFSVDLWASEWRLLWDVCTVSWMTFGSFKG